MRHWLLMPGLVLLTACSGPATDAVSATLELEPCRLRGGSGMTSVPAECGTLTVPEDPDAPEGSQIELAVARVAALDQRFPGNAFTAIAGGPGQASTEFYADYAHAFDSIHRYHDIVIVDQRGTGASNALDCDFSGFEAIEYSPDAARRLAQDCLDKLPADPRYYTTSLAVRDLDAVRAALGYEQLDVYGASYGTRVALHYLRRFPEHVRTVILDGVIAADQLVGPDIALHAQDALDSIFLRCDADDACSERFPDPASQFARIRRDVRETPVDLPMADPVTGEPTTATLTYEALAGAVRLLSYTPGTASLLPLLIDEAEARGNWQPLAAQAQMTLGAINDALNEGMHNAIVCTEDAPFFDIGTAQRARLGETYLGEMIVDSLDAICSIWPAGLIDDDFHDPVVSDRPVLLMSGSVDPVTPPENASRAAQTLSDSVELVAEGHGHGVLGVRCVPDLMASFVDAGSTDAIDAGCLTNKAPDPFFLRFTGPDP